MKKIIIFAMLVSIFLLSFSGCSSSQSEEKYEIKLANFSDSVASASFFDKEYDGIDWISFVDENVPQTLQMTVGDFVFEGNYSETTRRNADNYYTHLYIGEGYYRLGIAEDGRVVLFRYNNDTLRSTGDIQETDKVYSKEECKAVACDFIENILKIDADQYTVSDLYPKYDEESRTYEFVFVKYIDGFKTADQIKLIVAEKNGLICEYYAFMLDKIPTNAQVNFDIEEIERQTIAKLDEIFADCGRDDTEYSIYDYKLTKDENDNYMLIIRVNVTYIEVSEDGTRYRQGGENLEFVAWEN